MATFKIALPDGREFDIDGPDDWTDVDAFKALQVHISQPATDSTPPEGWSRSQVKDVRFPVNIDQSGASPLANRIAGANVRGSFPGRVAMGAADPSVAALQVGANLTPWGQDVNEFIAENEQRYQAVRKDTGADEARFIGNIVAPANLLAAKVLPGGSTVATGLKTGAVGGAMTPVTDAKSISDFWGVKVAQTGAGAAAGGILSPILGKLSGFIGKWLARPNPEITGARASLMADEAMAAVMRDLGPESATLPPNVVTQLRQEVVNALKEGRQIDAAALARKMDFDALGMQGTLGQITRDPTQFANERNLRGVANVGEPLMQRFEQQNQQLVERMRAPMRGTPASPYEAGTRMVGDLKSVDESMRSAVSQAYKAARESSGKTLTVPMQGLAYDAAGILDDFGDKVPSAIRSRLEGYGLFTGNQTKVFDVDEAEKFLKLINDHVGNDQVTNTALSRLRDAVKRAVITADDQGGVFAKPREMAAKRFQLQDAIPALQAASQGGVNEDRFVQRYIIDAPTNEAERLAGLLKRTAPESFDEARRQIAQKLYNAAFGADVVGDSPFSAKRYAAELNRIGKNKLGAFFTPDEVNGFSQIGRVGAYIHSIPNASPVQHSNNAAFFGSLLQRIPGVPQSLSLLMSAKNALNNQATVRSAMAGAVPSGPAPVTPEQQAAIDFMRNILGIQTGAAAASGL